MYRFRKSLLLRSLNIRCCLELSRPASKQMGNLRLADLTGSVGSDGKIYNHSGLSSRFRIRARDLKSSTLPEIGS